MLASFAVALTFALVHLSASKLSFLTGSPRRRWLSLAGGVSVAYVFLHLLPELSVHQAALGENLLFVERHVYILALAGLGIFYGLERAALTSRDEQTEAGEGDQTSKSVFWLHVISFSVYNMIISYLLAHRENHGTASLVWDALALALHFFVIDYGLHDHHKTRYRNIGRFVLATSVLIGWLLSVTITVTEIYVTQLFAFLAGSIILNALKEELPEERKSSFWAFALGLVGYALLILYT